MSVQGWARLVRDFRKVRTERAGADLCRRVDTPSHKDPLYSRVPGEKSRIL